MNLQRSLPRRRDLAQNCGTTSCSVYSASDRNYRSIVTERGICGTGETTSYQSGGLLRAQASIKKQAASASETRPPLPAAFLASSSSATSLCSSLWSERNDTQDPDVSAAETQFRRNIREDAAWKPDGAARTQSYLSNLCDAHTPDTLSGTIHPRRQDLP